MLTLGSHGEESALCGILRRFLSFKFPEATERDSMLAALQTINAAVRSWPDVSEESARGIDQQVQRLSLVYGGHSGTRRPRGVLTARGGGRVRRGPG